MEKGSRFEEGFTQEEFWEWLQTQPDPDKTHCELIHGQIVMSPPAGWPHAGIGSALNGFIGQHVRERDLGLVLDGSAGFDFPSGDTLEPDLSFISKERFAASPPTWGRFLRIVPDLVVEILSRSTAARDRHEKLEIYAQNGVREYWLVDPHRREVLVLDRADGGFDAPRISASGRIESRVLPGLEISVEDLFAHLD